MPCVVWAIIVTHLQNIQLDSIEDSVSKSRSYNAVGGITAPFHHLPIAIEVAILVCFVARCSQYPRKEQIKRRHQKLPIGISLDKSHLINPSFLIDNEPPVHFLSRSPLFILNAPVKDQPFSVLGLMVISANTKWLCLVSVSG